MNTIRVPLSDCTDNELIAVDILNDHGVVLVRKDTVLNHFIKNKLEEMGCRHIHIYDSCTDNCSASNKAQFRKDYKEAVLQVKSLLIDLAAGDKLDYTKVSLLCHYVYEAIEENEAIVHCLQEIRSSDEYTYTHCLNTAFYAMLLGKWLKLPKQKIWQAIQAGLLHDIGKTKIPIEILNKQGILTKDEYEYIKTHTVMGYQMLADSKNVDAEIKLAVLQHHERIDGSGYPNRVSSTDLCIFSKLVAISDVYDAMTSDRVYKKRVTPFDAFEMFQTVGIGIFDTTVLTTFLSHIAKYYTSANVLLNTGEEGKIAYIPPHDIVHPILEVGGKYLDLANDKLVKIIEMV